MSSAAKTLELLDLFTPAQPEIGLTQLCKLAKRDKATTYRHIQALEVHGLVEQNPLTKAYRLGPALLQLAQMREATVPRKVAAEPALTALAEATGETAHVSVLSADTMYALAACESPRHSTRVIIDIRTLPLHATASGCCALAFGPEELMAKARGNLEVFSATTPATPEALTAKVQQAKTDGFAVASQSYEDEVYSLAAPLFDQSGLFAGAVAVASVATRFTPALDRCIKENLMSAAREISRSWGGKIPAEIETSWTACLAGLQQMEPTT